MSWRLKKNMSFCRSCTQPGGKCHGKYRCNFAHSINEVKPSLCPYGVNCTTRWRERRTCGYIHVDENINDYSTRQGFCERRKMLNKPNTCHKGIEHLTSLEYASIIIEKLKNFEPIDSSTNIGAIIMKKWGWDVEKGLGKTSSGILVPLVHTCKFKNMLCEKQRVKGPLEPIKFIKSL